MFQGSISGQLLFIILVNDVYLVLDKCKILMYADVSVMFLSDRTVTVVEDVLNQEANLVGKWFTKNNLLLNFKKSKTEFFIYVINQKLAKQQSCSVSQFGTPINLATSYEYLGVTMDNHLTMKLQTEKTYKKAKNRVKLL